MKIIADSHIPYIHEYFSYQAELILKPGRTITAEDVKDADVLLVRSITHVDEKLLANSQVKFVGSVTSGADHLDTVWLDKVGIAWSVALGFNAPPVADYVVSVVAALQKKNMLVQKNIKTAVIGLGNVGRLVQQRFNDLNFEVKVCDPLRQKNEKNFISTPLEALENLDLISLHVPLIKSGPHATYHFIDKDFLRRQKPGCVLLNASRGSVINSLELLEYGKHLHWCFDVWEHEPKINKAVLEQTLIATPHIAGYSVQSKIRGIDMIYQIMCEKNIISPRTISPLAMPVQQLEFDYQTSQWQDIVLSVFNPNAITDLLASSLLSLNEFGHFFDEIRNQFNYRYELGYTGINGVTISDYDRLILKKLGLQI